MSAVHGSKIIYLYRTASMAKNAAVRAAYATDNSTTISVDSESTSTKDGNITRVDNPSTEISAESILKKSDELIPSLRKAMLNKEEIEVWETNLDEPASEGQGKYKGIYYKALLTEFEKSSASDDWTTVSLTFAVNGVGAEGEVTVPDDIASEVEEVFKDATAEA